MRVLTIIILILACHACTLEEIPDLTTSTEPIANFEIVSQSNNGSAPSTVVFQNTSTNTNSYSWNFGDLLSGANNTSIAENPTHTFNNAGVYEVTLTALNDATEEEDIFTLSVTVGEVITFSTFFPSMGSVREIIQTTDGKYVMVGTNDNRTSLSILDAEGNMAAGMPKVYENDNNYGEAVVQTLNGGFAIAGGRVDNGLDFQLILTDNEGNELAGSPKTYSAGTGADYAHDIIQMNDGGFAITGLSHNGTDVDFWLVLTDSEGNELPSSPKRFPAEGEYDDVANAIIQMDNGNLAIVGSDNGDVRLILTNSVGNEIVGSPKLFDINGGAENGYDIIQTENGGLAICGVTNNSTITKKDMLLILTDANGNELPNSPQQFDATNKDDIAYSLTQTKDGGFAIIGYTTTPDNDSDVWLILTDVNGNELQHSPISFDYELKSNKGYSIIRTNDGGFAIAASYQDSNTQASGVWIIKTDADGLIE